MKLKRNCMFSNAKVNEVGGTPDWEHTLGQSVPLYLLKEDGCSDIINGLAYNLRPLEGFNYGSGGNNYDIQMVSIFENISLKIFDSQTNSIEQHQLSNPLIVILVRQSEGEHNGRRLLKLGRGFSYNTIQNSAFYDEINILVPNPWFGYKLEYDNRNTGLLTFTIIKAPISYPIETDDTVRYTTRSARKTVWEDLARQYSTQFEIEHTETPNQQSPYVSINSSTILLSIPRNKIIYGAPGTGKSYELRDQARAIGFNEDDTIRVTFHPNYSYQQFVGTYKPTPIYRNVLQEGAVLYGSDKTTELQNDHKKEPLIDYSFVPGPLLNLLVKALINTDKNYLLIIEEINRASVSAVFGDVFQLLDRKSDGSSEYSITFNEEAMSFLRANGIPFTEIKLPNNFFMWATMNSADQGVMPLDAAFKRRWAFEYLPLNEKQSKVANSNIRFQGEDFNWNNFRKIINDKLKDMGVAEDKLIGPFFMNSNELSDENSVKNKLLLYLRDDVVRHNPESLFKKKTYSDIIEMYSKGENIFVNLEIKTESIPEPQNIE